MKILFITAFPPCQKTAGQDYSRRLLQDLVNHGNNVSLIYAEFPHHNLEIDSRIEVIDKIHPSIFNCFNKCFFHPFFTRRYNKEIEKKIQNLSPKFDMIYFDFSQVHIYSYNINHPNKVLMCHDVIVQKYSRKNRLQLPWIKLSEGKILRTGSSIITFSKKDCEYLHKKYNLKSTNVNFYLKNGNFKYENTTVYNNRFCFYGAWNRPENFNCLKWFINKVYPFLSNKQLEFIIIGGGLAQEIQNSVKKYKNITYVGFVENPLDEISSCQALIAPLKKGAGVKVKVIDALSTGTYVIGTNVAFEGIVDNISAPIFITAIEPAQYVNILNNWKSINKEYKQAAADEFFENYNKNHFIDIIK